MFQTIRFRRTFWTFALAVLISGCAPLIAKYDPVAYEKAVDLKVESLSLVAKATDPYDQHKDEAEGLNMKLQKAYEYAQGRPDNSVSAQQWQLMASPDKALMGGFLTRWKVGGKLGQVYLQEKSGELSKAFDTIIGLESGKIKAGQ